MWNTQSGPAEEKLAVCGLQCVLHLTCDRLGSRLLPGGCCLIACSVWGPQTSNPLDVASRPGAVPHTLLQKDPRVSLKHTLKHAHTHTQPCTMLLKSTPKLSESVSISERCFLLSLFSNHQQAAHYQLCVDQPARCAAWLIVCLRLVSPGAGVVLPHRSLSLSVLICKGCTEGRHIHKTHS